jgi:hypothetical protein
VAAAVAEEEEAVGEAEQQQQQAIGMAANCSSFSPLGWARLGTKIGEIIRNY